MVRALIIALVMGLGLVATGCDDGGGDVDITLQEFAKSKLRPLSVQR